MKVNHNIAVSESGFLFNPSTGESFTLNPIGARLITLFKEGLSDEEILQKITEEYNVEKNDLSKDLLDFENMLRTYHLVINDNE